MDWPAGAREFVESCRVARLATTDAAGEPHAVPICYVLIDERIYSVVDEKPKATLKGLKRLRNIAANPRVAVLVDHYDDDWRQLAYVLIRGEAEIVDHEDEYDAVLAALQTKYPQYRSMDLEVGSHPMLRITARTAHFWTFE